MCIDIKCEDFLQRNSHLYATKATRKKIALIRVEATNRQSCDLTLRLGAASLTAGGNSHNAEQPVVVVRKLSEFTWDFLLFAITDIFNPITAAAEGLVFLAGPLYNRRLRRKLKLLTNEDLVLPPGEPKVALVGFRGVRKGLEALTIPYRSADGDERQVQWRFETQGSNRGESR